MPSDHQTTPLLLTWLAVVLAGIGLAWVSGRLEPILVPDSQSYQNYCFDSLTEMGRSIRTPGYPAWLTIITATLGLSFVPLLQVVVHAWATWWLWYELRCWGMIRGQAIAAAFAVGVGCTAMDHINVISTDALAASLGVMTVVASMRWTRRGDSVSALLLTVLLAVVTIAIRPAYLFLPVWLLIGGACLRRRVGMPWGWALQTSSTATLLVVIPIIGWCAVRQATVNDFGIVPFGHQNLAGVLVQLVSDDELSDLGELGRTVVKRKRDYISTLDQSADDPPYATMTIDARWDAMTYAVVIPAADDVVGGDVIKSHRAVKGLNRTIVYQWPGRYAIWIAKAIRRGAWAIAADIVMHPIFLAMISLALVLVLYRSVDAIPFRPAITRSVALDALAIVAISYLVLKLGFVALTSPPIGRFSDAAAIFLPALAVAGFVRWYSDGDG